MLLQERILCNVEVVTFVVEGSLELAVSLDLSYNKSQIQQDTYNPRMVMQRTDKCRFCWYIHININKTNKSEKCKLLFINL